MSSDRTNDSTTDAVDAMDARKQYYNTRPAPADPKAWFDEHYSDAACDALVELPSM